MTELELAGEGLVHLDDGTYMWVDLLHFAVRGLGSDEEVLNSLLSTAAYQHDYVSPFDATKPDEGIHARWQLDRLDASMFSLLSPLVLGR